ncbi:hypothetical protein BDV98DRAFT_36705 [Pterulicium gracile]|uniref:Uncharacterized protein n=1 Tax=Pterulicium gracile TaxID=1884261 RepID=A0A5C3R0N7_9AGAR|nr:hypothetical protein BDV98DRAFT_36705 [Pterula gracilis]
MLHSTVRRGFVFLADRPRQVTAHVNYHTPWLFQACIQHCPHISPTFCAYLPAAMRRASKPSRRTCNQVQFVQHASSRPPATGSLYAHVIRLFRRYDASPPGLLHTILISISSHAHKSHDFPTCKL